MAWSYKMGKWREVNSIYERMEGLISQADLHDILDSSGCSGYKSIFGYRDAWGMALCLSGHYTWPYIALINMPFGILPVLVDEEPSIIMLSKEISDLWRNSVSTTTVAPQ